MIVTLTGDNDFLINQELAKLKSQLNSDDLSSTAINGSEASLEDVKLELASYSLFSSSRLVILSEASKIKGFSEAVEELVDILPDSTVLVLVEPSLDKRKSYYKYLSKNTDFKNCLNLNKPMLSKWASDYAIEQGGKLSLNDAGYLVDRLGDDQLLLSQEISKLLLYSNDITHESIDLLTEPSPSSTVFQLLDAAFSSNPKQALKIYEEQRLQKVEPEQILAMLSWQLNNLALAMTAKNLPQGQVLSISGLAPFTLSKARQMSQKLTFSNLKTLVQELTNLDFKTKTSGLSLDAGLKNFIVALSY